MTKIVYFGNERLATGVESTTAPILNGLIERGYEVVAVVSNYTAGRSRNQRRLEVADIAEANNIPLLLPDRPNDIKAELSSLGADIAVLAAYGRIIGQSVIDIFPGGIVNLHPSLLPQYRGPTPIESAILNGDSETGVSLMQLTSGMDEGPVYAQTTIALSRQETKVELHDQLAQAGAKLFFEAIPDIISGALQPVAQDSARATYGSLIDKADGLIDWTKLARQLEREIRAYQGWPGSRTKLGTIDVTITAAHVVASASSHPGAISVPDTGTELLVATGDGALSIDLLKPSGKKEMPIRAFLAGYKQQLSDTA